MMGKTPRPLRILVHSCFLGESWVEELKAKGHEVVEGWNTESDLILAPQAARFLPGMEKFLPDFIKGARAVKYPKAKA